MFVNVITTNIFKRLLVSGGDLNVDMPNGHIQEIPGFSIRNNNLPRIRGLYQFYNTNTFYTILGYKLFKRVVTVTFFLSL